MGGGGTTTEWEVAFSKTQFGRRSVFTTGTFAKAIEVGNRIALAMLVTLLMGCGIRYRKVEPVFDHLPEPVSVLDFIELEKRHGRLDQARWEEIEAIHRNYLADYSAWRRRSIAGLQRALEGRVWSEARFDPDTIEDLERVAASNMKALAFLDDRSILQLEQALGDTPWRNAIEHLRIRRAMARWLAIVEAGGGMPQDLRRWVEGQAWLDGYPSVRDEIETRLDGYEIELLPILERLAVAEWSLPGRELEGLLQASDVTGEPIPPDEVGFLPQSLDLFDTDEQRRPSSIDREAIVAAAREPVARELQRILDLQVRSIRLIGGLLPDPLGDLLAAEFLAGTSSFGSGEVAVGLGLALVDEESDADRPPRRWKEFRDEGRNLLRRRVDLHRRLLEATRKASAPGALAGGRNADEAREDASSAIRARLAVFEGEIAAWISRWIESGLLAGMSDGVSPPTGATTSPDEGSSAVPGRDIFVVHRDSRLGRFDLPLDGVSLIEAKLQSISDNAMLSEIAANVVQTCVPDPGSLERLELELERDDADQRRLVEDASRRIEDAFNRAVTDLRSLATRDEEQANGAEGSPSRTDWGSADLDAIRDALEEHFDSMAADVRTVLTNMDESQNRSIDRIEAVLSEAACEWCSTLLRLAIAESVWQILIGLGLPNEISGRGVGRGVSVARLLDALPLDPLERAEVCRLVEPKRVGIRRGLEAQHDAAADLLVANVEQASGLRGVPAVAAVRPELERFHEARIRILGAQLELLQDVEGVWPASAPVLREAALEARWGGIWDDTAAIVEETAKLIRSDESLAAWRTWRSEFAEAVGRELLLKPASTMSFGPAGAVDDLLRACPELHAAKVAHREGLFWAMQRITAGETSSGLDRASSLRADVARDVAARLDGDRIWE